MPVPFSENPGRHERHLRRRLDNPLFGDRAVLRDDAALFEAQRLDHEELLGFVTELRQVVGEAIDLSPDSGSEPVLAIKERLDRLYEQSAGLAEDHSENQAAIRQLLEVIMRTVERGAGGDPVALAELAEEREARAAHFALLAEPLVADLLHPDSTITPDQLAPTLLSASASALDAALNLFQPEPLAQLYADAEACLARCPAPPASAAERLRQIGRRLAGVVDPRSVN